MSHFVGNRSSLCEAASNPFQPAQCCRTTSKVEAERRRSTQRRKRDGPGPQVIVGRARQSRADSGIRLMRPKASVGTFRQPICPSKKAAPNAFAISRLSKIVGTKNFLDTPGGLRGLVSFDYCELAGIQSASHPEENSAFSATIGISRHWHRPFKTLASVQPEWCRRLGDRITAAPQ